MTRGEKIRTKLFLFFIGMFRRMTLGARGVLIDGERVFLVRHTYVSGWHFPGGGVEPGETVEASLRRELVEEAGYEATGPVKLFGIYLNAGVSGRDHVLVYTISDFKRLREFSPNAEIAEAGWFERDELPVETTPGTRRRIGEIFDKKGPEQIW